MAKIFISHFLHISIVLTSVYIARIAPFQPNSCEEYEKLLPDGICKEYFQNKKIAQDKSRALKLNEKLIKVYKEIIPLYMRNPSAIKEMVKYVIAAKCGHNEGVMNIIDSYVMPSEMVVTRCMEQLKKYICQVDYPLCIDTKEGEKYVLVPCQKYCAQFTNWTGECSFFNTLQIYEDQIIAKCPSWVKVIEFDCANYPVSTDGKKEYCRDGKLPKGSKKGIEPSAFVMSNTIGRNSLSDIRKNMSDTQVEQMDSISEYKMEHAKLLINYRRHYKTPDIYFGYHPTNIRPISVIVSTVIVILVVSLAFIVYTYHKKRKNATEFYQSTDDKPDICYVRVES